MLGHTPAKLGGQRYRGTGDMISQNHGNKKYSSTMGKSPWRLVTILPSLVDQDTVVVKIDWF